MFLLSHISLAVSHPSWLPLPGCRGQKQEKLNQRETHWLTVQEGGLGDLGDGRMEGDREDETRQGGTLSQQGVRKRVKRVMLSSGLPLPISSHYCFIPPSVCTSQPHFPFCFLCWTTFCHICSWAGQARGEALKKLNWRIGLSFKGLYLFVTDQKKCLYTTPKADMK